MDWINWINIQLLATKSNSRMVFKVAKAEKPGEEETDTQDRQRDSKIESSHLGGVPLRT